MKKTICGLLIAGIISALACSTKPSDGVQKSESKEGTFLDASRTLFAVPIDKVKKDTAYYDSIFIKFDSLVAVAAGKKPSKQIPIKSFTVHTADLFEAMGMPVRDTNKTVFKYVRVYLGLDKKAGFKLYLTPVKGKNVTGQDSILNYRKLQNMGDGGGYMLDFSSPCPKTCPN